MKLKPLPEAAVDDTATFLIVTVSAAWWWPMHIELAGHSTNKGPSVQSQWLLVARRGPTVASGAVGASVQSRGHGVCLELPGHK